uniref:Uncharacterized protein n=1 Tax=Leersia perrieri TaxID=77586 RepID=A0A0D9WEB2_9ORYZ
MNMLVGWIHLFMGHACAKPWRQGSGTAAAEGRVGGGRKPWRRASGWWQGGPAAGVRAAAGRPGGGCPGVGRSGQQHRAAAGQEQQWLLERSIHPFFINPELVSHLLWGSSDLWSHKRRHTSNDIPVNL